MPDPVLLTRGMTPPPPVVQALLGKVPLTPETYGELANLDYQATAAAFTASGLSNLSLVARLQESLVQAIEKGQSLGSFKAQVSETLAKTMGEKRLELVYRVNVHQAYMAGRWEGIEQTKEDYPYLQYDALEDGRTRPAHEALNGLVYPVDSPFWQDHYPPNGFRCRCNVRQLSQASLERKGLKVSRVKPDNQAKPDPGWSGNQARDQLAYLQGLEAKRLEGLPLEFARRYLQNKNRRDPSFKHFVWGQGLPHEMRPVGVLVPEVAAEMGSEGQVVFLKTEVAAKQWRNHPEVGPEMYLNDLSHTLETDLALSFGTEEGKEMLFRPKGGGDWFWRAVVRKEPAGLLLVSFHKVKLNDLSTAIRKALER